MASMDKTKEWIKENVPMLAVLYENKYVGMAYDRFASLPPKQQKQTLIGAMGIVVLFIVGFLLASYFSLWSSSSQAKKSYEMVNLLLEYQKHRRDQSDQISNLERNNALSGPGEFKKHLMDEGRNAAISPRMMEIDEKPDGAEGDSESKANSDVKIRQASVSLKKVNLNQLKAFLNNVEFGPFNLSISSIKVTNDDKIRGYMNVDMEVVAYLFQAEGGG